MIASPFALGLGLPLMVSSLLRLDVEIWRGIPYAVIPACDATCTQSNLVNNIANTLMGVEKMYIRV